MSEIFVSYSWMDSVFARNLANCLSEEGHRVWIDYQDLDLTGPLAPQLSLAIRSADLFLVIRSPHSCFSRWVQFELSLAKAWRKSIRVIPYVVSTLELTHVEGVVFANRIVDVSVSNAK